MSRGGPLPPREPAGPEPSGRHSPLAPSRAAALGLAPHPEGGWYRRTWTSPADLDGRPAATAILFLLAPGERSAPHTVDADELWLWHGPGALVLRLEEQAVVLDAAHPQVLVPAGTRQATEPAAEEVLVSCVVSPGFQWRGFRME